MWHCCRFKETGGNNFLYIPKGNSFLYNSNIFWQILMIFSSIPITVNQVIFEFFLFTFNHEKNPSQNQEISKISDTIFTKKYCLAQISVPKFYSRDWIKKVAKIYWQKKSRFTLSIYQTLTYKSQHTCYLEQSVNRWLQVSANYRDSLYKTSP